MSGPRKDREDEGTCRPGDKIDIENPLSGETPCALVDPNGRIVRASPGLLRLRPALEGEILASAFSLTLASDSPSPGKMIYGTYPDSSGESVPIAIQFLSVGGQSAFRLAIFFDGLPFRQADLARLSTAPYPALRTTSRGTITAVTDDMSALFKSEAFPSLMGVCLLSLFDEADRKRIEASLASCLGGNAVQPLNVVVLTANGGERAELALLPDCGPDQRVLGAIALIRSRKIEDCRERLKQIAMEAGAWRTRLAAVINELRGFLAFDFVTFGVYAADMSAFCATYVEPKTMVWPSIWIKIEPNVRMWLTQGRTFEYDLPDFIKKYPETAKDPVTRRYQRAGTRAFITVPVLGETGPICSLTLISKQPSVYDAQTLALLRELAVDQVLTTFYHEGQLELKDVARDIDEAVNGVGSLKEAADCLVTKLHDFFEWDHVSIVTRDRRRNSFKLLAQAFSDGCEIPADFRQGDEEGMLGLTLSKNEKRTERERECLIVSDEESAKLANYKPTNGAMQSALTCPIWFNGEWRWILNIEAVELNAFHQVDKDEVLRIVSALEASLHRLYQAKLNHVILESTREGVIVVDHDGKILDANQTANDRLLGTKNDYGNIESYAHDSTTRKILRGELADGSRRLVIRSKTGAIRTVLGLRSDLANELQASVWLLTDLDTLDWNIDFRYLRTIATDVAQQTRPSLMLASAILQKMVKEVRSSSVGPRIRLFAEQAVAQVAKADITFERLAELQSITKSPKREPTEVDLGELIEDVIHSFPEYDRKNINWNAEVKAITEGDRSNLGFVFRSLIDYLLRCLVEDDDEQFVVQIRLRPSQRTGCLVLLKLSNARRVVAGTGQPIDPLWQAVNTAHVDTGLGLSAVEAVLAAHDGSLKKYEGDHDPTIPGPLWTAFVITLPLKDKMFEARDVQIVGVG
jgi:PAS domain-containing protein